MVIVAAMQKMQTWKIVRDVQNNIICHTKNAVWIFAENLNFAKVVIMEFMQNEYQSNHKQTPKSADTADRV